VIVRFVDICRIVDQHCLRIFWSFLRCNQKR